MIRDVGMGSDYPVTVQSMTNTDSHDVAATLAQVEQLAALGAAIGGAGYGRCAGCCRGGAPRQRADRR